jgi:hypothetical protein
MAALRLPDASLTVLSVILKENRPVFDILRLKADFRVLKELGSLLVVIWNIYFVLPRGLDKPTLDQFLEEQDLYRGMDMQ